MAALDTKKYFLPEIYFSSDPPVNDVMESNREAF